MGTSVLTHTETDPAGNPVTYVANFRLTTAAGQESGFRLSNGMGISSVTTTTSNGSGAISIALENNSNITPGGSFYIAELLLPSSAGGTQEAAIISSSSANPQSIYNALVSAIPSYVPPTTVPPTVLTGNNTFTGTNKFSGNVFFGSGIPWADPYAFGAVGNGVADDTVAMQNWAASGGNLFLAAGTFNINGSMSPPAGTLIQGAGRTAAVVQQIGTGDTWNCNGVSNVTFRDFTLNGTSSSRYGWYVGNSFRVIIENIVASSHGQRVIFYDGSVPGGTFRHTVRSSLFTENHGEGIRGILVNSVLLEDNYFNNCCKSTGLGQTVFDNARGVTWINNTWDGQNIPPAGVVVGTSTDGTNLGWNISGGYMENNLTGVKIGNLGGANNAQAGVIQGLEIVASSCSTRSIVLDHAQGTMVQGCFFTNQSAPSFNHIGTTTAAFDTWILANPAPSGSGGLTDVTPKGTRTWVAGSTGGGIQMFSSTAQQSGFDDGGRSFVSTLSTSATSGGAVLPSTQPAGYFVINVSGVGLQKVAYWPL